MDSSVKNNMRSDGMNQSGRYYVSKSYTYYVLAVLWLVALFRFIDLQIIAVLLESIRAEFGFSDTQLGVLTGFAFALFYATLGIPIAWLADRYNRRNIVSVVLGLWSFMTVLCGFATGFISLFLARMGVGVGEAGGYPPSTSLLSDYFPEHRRGFAFSVLGAAIPIGVFAGFLIGGVVNEYYGWRMAFIIVGLPGILLAVLVRLTVREPPRGYSDANPAVVQATSFKEALRYLWGVPSYKFVVMGACLFTLGAYGSGVWIPSFFIRAHGMSSSEVGLWMAGLYGGGGLLGTILGGALADRLANKSGNRGWYMYLSGISLIFILPPACFVYLWPNPREALMMHFFVTFLMHMNVGPVLAMVQSISGVPRRSMGQAINVLVTNIVALSLGPLIVGTLSDAYSPIWGDRALGYAILALVLVAYTAASLSFITAGKHLDQESVAGYLPKRDKQVSLKST